MHACKQKTHTYNFIMKEILSMHAFSNNRIYAGTQVWKVVNSANL